MEEKILKDVIDDLKESLKEKGKYIRLSYDSYVPIEISTDNFHEIKDSARNNKIAFVDGGNAEILKAANFSLQFIRVYYTIYQNNKRIKNKRYEFYLLIKAFDKDGKIFYKTKSFGDNIIESLEFDEFDDTLTQGRNKADISFVGNVARRFSELSIAKELLDELDPDDFIVLDGSLEAKYSNEEKILDEIYQKSSEKKIAVCGLSKTCELLTDKGSSFIGVLKEIEQKKEWYYHPAANIPGINFDIIFAKLNENSDYIFRIDIMNNKIEELLGLLKLNSRDPVFIGYPYALVEADKFARVSNKELEIFKTRFIIKAGKEWKRINDFLKAKDSHSILDSIS